MTIAGTVIPLTLAAIYLTLFVLHARESDGGFSSLAAVAQLFDNRWLLLAGWVHYLAFDLFIGAWETRDAMARRRAAATARAVSPDDLHARSDRAALLPRGACSCAPAARCRGTRASAEG